MFCFQRFWIRFRLVPNGDEIQVARHSSQVCYVPGGRGQVYRSWTRIYQSWKIQGGCAHVSLVKLSLICNYQWSGVMWILVSFKSVDRYGVVWVQKGASLVVVFSSRIIQSENLTSKTVYLFSCKVTWQLYWPRTQIPFSAQWIIRKQIPNLLTYILRTWFKN